MRRNTVLFSVSAIWVLISSACGGTGAPATAAGPTQTIPPPATATLAPVTFLGEAIEQAGYFIQTLTVEDPAPPTTVYVPVEGKKLVAIEFIVGNLSGARWRLNPLDIWLQDQAGDAYPPMLGARADQIANLSLDQGEQVQGWVAFQLPAAAIPAHLVVRRYLTTEIFFQVGLAAPPAAHTPTQLSSALVRPPLSKLGETVTQGGYSITALGVEDPAQTLAYYPVEPDRRVVAVEVLIANVAGAKLHMAPEYFTLVDHQGFVYPMAVGAREGQMASVDLDVGGQAQGWVAFKLPAAAGIESLKCLPYLDSPLILQTGLVK